MCFIDLPIKILLNYLIIYMQVLQFYYSEIINNKHNINNIFKINIITKTVIEKQNIHGN